MSSSASAALTPSTLPLKAILDRSALLPMLALAQGIVERRVTTPILSHLLLETVEGQLKISATDLDMTFEATLPATVLQAGALTLPAHMFYDIVRKLPEGATVTLEQTTGLNNVRLTSGLSEFVLPTLPPTEFMQFVWPELPFQMTVPAPLLRDLLVKTRFAMSTEESRYTLNGIYLHVDKSELPTLKAVATDGHRLALAAEPVADLPDFPPAILPRKMVMELCKWLDTVSDTPVTVSLSDTQMTVSQGLVMLSSRLIDGVFPDYASIIPQEDMVNALIPITEMDQALGRVSMLAQDETRGLFLNFDADQLTLSTPQSDKGRAQEAISMTYAGPATRLAFNPRYLADVIQHITTPQLEFELVDAAHPVVVRGAGNLTTLYLLMPMRM